MHWEHMRWNHWWGMGLMGLFWIAILVLLVLLVLWLVRAGSSSKSPTTSSPGEGSAEDILKRRYARGEIDKEEYERRLTEIRR